MSARAIVMDGVEIPETLLAQEVQHHPGASAADARAAAGHALAIRALLLNRARELAVTATSERDEDGREETGEEAVIRALLDREVLHRSASDAECRRFYEARRDRFAAPPLFAASHILIEGHDEDARARATVIADMIRRGACTFAEAAGDYSSCPSGRTGGSLGQLRPGDLAPEVEAALGSLDVNEVSAEPVHSRFGWHVLRVDRRVPAGPLPFEAVVERIRLHLDSRAWTAAAARYVADLAAEARSRGVALTLSAEGDIRDGSATLGDLIGDDRAADRLESWLDAVDPQLGDRLRAAATEAGDAVPDLVRAAFADFVATANDERWTNLVSAVRDADDPALAGLAFILRSRLAPARQTLTLIRRTAP